MKTLRLSLIAFVAIATIASCTKHDDFENTLFDCECGTLNVNDRDITLRLAEGYNPDTSNTNLWRYHVVADYREEEPQHNHTPSEDLDFIVNMEYDGSSSSKDAVDVLTVTFLEQNNADIWEITDGEVIVNKNVASHNLIFSNIIADGKEINGQFTVSIQ
tara:strand:- start:1454 stop:1933 length:480 start_codon:yes stop_codon:yes gene_type:complete